MDLQDKVVVITGAGGGLGRTMAVEFAKQGAKLALIDLTAEGLNETATLVHLAKSEAKTYVCNVTNESDVEQTFGQIASDFSGIDGLINNAGILRDGLFVKVKEGEIINKMSLEQFQSVIDVNLTGVFLCAREASVQMIKHQRKGVIVNMSSIARQGNIGQTNYAASKAGVVAMTVTWARELGKHGIRVGAIAPGVVATPMTDAMRPEMRLRLEQMKPVGRLGTPEEIAHTARYIFENDFFTGRVVEIDGGLAM
ncbi:SDR family oxidoreductase [Thalassotalea aquiviva]|uniref:SDR family oxidoreductase n=1 Tax=Thalassotalea aquiviva TaxID=3242415 RepID=UPI00352A5B38